MTTIVAVERQTGVTFASDSRVTSSVKSDGWVEKVVTNNGVTFGTAGMLRAVQILQYASLPTLPSGPAEAMDRYDKSTNDDVRTLQLKG